MAEKKKKMTTIETIDSKDGVGGELRVAEGVVANIAVHVGKQIDGLSLPKSTFLSFGGTPGVEAEVGSKEAALDLDVYITYGVDAREVTKRFRDELARQVDLMTGRKLVEVNINIIGIQTEENDPEPEPVPEPEEEPKRRVR